VLGEEATARATDFSILCKNVSQKTIIEAKQARKRKGRKNRGSIDRRRRAWKSVAREESPLVTPTGSQRRENRTAVWSTRLRADHGTAGGGEKKASSIVPASSFEDCENTSGGSLTQGQGGVDLIWGGAGVKATV